MARAPPSVSRRLLFAVAVPLVLFFALTVAVLDSVFRQLADASLRELLAEQVVALVTAVDLNREDVLEVNLLDPESRLDMPGSGLYAAVRDQNGKLLWSSASLNGTGLELGVPLAVGGVELRTLQARDGTPVAELSRGLQWVYAAGVSKNLVFTAADSTEPQRQQLWRFRRQMAGWFGGLVLVLLATMAWMMRRALAPVRRLEQEIAAVESGAAQGLGTAYPRELAGVTKGLNALLQSERNRIARYRDTLGNLAHSLKTPLAVIRASLGTAESASAQREAIQLEIDRMAQIVEHQLKRAAAGGGVTLGQASVAVLPRVIELRAALLKVHADKDLRIEVDVPAQIGFLGDAGDVLELLGNVLDNACKWCRSRVAVSARLDAARLPSHRLSIVVEDDGPGIAATDRQRVIERGVRADEHVPGHGLGLAMVRETVALYGGELLIDGSPSLNGARVELQLPGR
ncbi:MAG TPA: ATP-binding protein [Steroidobacteraceae bacterium]|nr:ATP-binding protein [Steroidobacteraceae bacterium]